MPDHPAIKLNRLREIGWTSWDPIGLADTDCPRDEYDSYLLQAVSQLRQGQPVEGVSAYLEEIASQHMGLGTSTPSSRAASDQTAKLISEYLGNFPPGPLKVC